MLLIPLFVLALFVAAPAFAQSPYVVGSFGLDVSRLGAVESAGFEPPARDGEVMEVALRVGTSLGDRWGVELELARGGKIESESFQGRRALQGGALGNAISFTSGTGVTSVSVPALSVHQWLEQQHQTIAALAWLRQSIGTRVDLVYLGGVGFWRTEREQQISFSFPLMRPTIVAPSRITRVTTYGTAPVLGVEAHIGFTDHLRLVPGVRMQGIGDVEATGWMLRAGIGLGWFF